MRIMRKILLSIGLLLCIGSVGHAEDLYFGQSASGGNTGADCANQHAYTWFNTAANWGGGANEIDPGDTAHICGTVSNGIAFQGSGTSGNVITLKFESGAKMSAAVYSGVWIDTTGVSYIVIDGGIPCGVTNGAVTTCSTNRTGTGIIENTGNGSVLANQINSSGIGTGSSCGRDIEIKNLIVQNMYVKVYGTTENSGGAELSADIYLGNNCGSNILIHDNTVAFSNTPIVIGSAGASPNNWQVYNNVVRNGHWGINLQMGSGSGVATNWLVYGNDVDISNEWGQADGFYHDDPIMIFGNSATSYASGIYVFNNHLHGNWNGVGGSCASGGMWINGWLRNIGIFNNVINTAGGGTCNGQITPGAYAQNVLIANNTLLNATGTNGIGDPYGNENGATSIYSNILYNITSPLTCYDNRNDIYNIDHNNYYLWNAVQPGPTPFNCGQGFGDAFSTGADHWQNDICGTSGLPCDANGSEGNPNLAASYPFTLQTGSAAIGLGKNLYSTCNGQPNPGLGALCYDKAGVARPSSGAWDAGAYQYGAAPPVVKPPTHLTVIIN